MKPPTHCFAFVWLAGDRTDGGLLALNCARPSWLSSSR